MEAKDIDFNFEYAGTMHAGHRTPRDAGSADYYYWRSPEPNFSYHGRKFVESEMTPEMISQYWEGYQNETERKDYGWAYGDQLMGGADAA